MGARAVDVSVPVSLNSNENRESCLCLGCVEEKTGLIIDLPIHCSTPVVQVMPPHFRDGNYVIVFLLHSALIEDLLSLPVISDA